MISNKIYSPLRLLSSALFVLLMVNHAEALGDESLNANKQTTVAAAGDKWYERSFEQLLNTKIITSTRQEQSISLSPNNVSVYTAADLKRMGIRSIKELLDRTPGFFVNQQLAGPAIGSRGFIGDNEQFLLLIDGHSANSIVDKGAGNFFIFPFLEHIDRVEILRGPGSTLWGSDAALGIIHIITKDGSDMNGLTASYSAASADNYQYMNVRSGKAVSDDISYMFSVTSAKSNGFPNEKPNYLAGDGRWEAFDDSHEIYVKAKIQDFTVYARSADMRNLRPGGSIALNSLDIWFSPSDYEVYKRLINEKAWTRRQQNYIDIQHNKQLSDTFSLETRFFNDLIQGYQAQINPALTQGAIDIEESGANKENSLGLETIGRWKPGNGHQLMIGLRAVQTEVDPVSNSVLYPATTNATDTATLRSIRAVPKGKDRNIAVFIEDDWAINESINLIYGVRIDKNTLREDNTIVLPRLGLNWKFNQDWAVQYSYTTGYIRPPVGIGFLGQEQYNTNLSAPGGKIYGATESEEVGSNEIRLTYTHDPISFKWNFYNTIIDNSFNFIYEPENILTFDRILFYVNTNKITTRGTEFEFNYFASDIWNLYANASYVYKANLADPTGSAFGINFDLNNTVYNFSEGLFTQRGDNIGYPHLMWNFGVNVFFSDSLSANLHYRGWTSMPTRKNVNLLYPGPSDRSFGPEHFFDLNLRYEEVGGTKLNLGFFIKNLLNNDTSRIRTLYFSQDWSERKRSIGFDASYTF